jgi:hypothetical protein
MHDTARGERISFIVAMYLVTSLRNKENVYVGIAVTFIHDITARCYVLSLNNTRQCVKKGKVFFLQKKVKLSL